MGDGTHDETGTDQSQTPFALTEYVEAANDASNRTRYVSIVLLVATILIFVGLNNSYMNAWTVDDIRAAYRPSPNFIMGALHEYKIYGSAAGDEQYLKRQCDTVGNPMCAAPIDQARWHAQETVMRLYMENKLIKIPILGVSIHVNDLGLIGGITLIVLLLLLRTSLSREIKNLNYAFKKAYEVEKLDDFYEALAMRQLFTVPHMKGERRNRFLSKLPYGVCVLPVFIYLALVAYDIFTVVVLPRYNAPFKDKGFLDVLYKSLEDTRIIWLMAVEGICALAVCFIAFRCAERQHYIYSIWDNYWSLLNRGSELCLIEPAIAARLRKGEDYFVSRPEGKAERAELSPKIMAGLEQAKALVVKRKNVYVFRWLWQALKDEIRPVLHFFSHGWRFIVKHERIDEKPLLITTNFRLAELFSNDKEINDTLREILPPQREESPAEGADAGGGGAKSGKV